MLSTAARTEGKRRRYAYQHGAGNSRVIDGVKPRKWKDRCYAALFAAGLLSKVISNIGHARLQDLFPTWCRRISADGIPG
jgi:hypothetical protein